MRTVQFDAVEADALGGRSGLGEGADDIVEIGLRHRLARALGAVDPDAGGPTAGASG